MNASTSQPRPIRLALVITELAVGGAERNFVRLAKGLPRDEFEVRVFSLKPSPQAPKDELIGELASAGVPVEFLNVRSAWQVPIATRRLAKRWREWQPAIVQSFLFHANTVSTWAARLANRPQVVWGLRVADPNPRRQWLERRLAGRVCKIVCVSQSVRDFAATKLAIPSEKLEVIPNGLELDRYRDAQPIDANQLRALGVPPDARLLLCIGRLHEQKGFDWLLSFAPELLAALPEHHLMLVGDGPQRGELEAMAKRSPVSGRIHFAGFRSDIPRWLASAEIMLLPSRWEGMPNVVLEAMAAARPVVATATHGVEEALGSAAADQTVASGDARAFLENVIALGRDREKTAQLGRQNLVRVEHEFSLAAMLARHRQLYRLLAANES